MEFIKEIIADPYFLYYLSTILLIPFAIWAMTVQVRVKSVFKKYSAVPLSRNYTGADMARSILDKNGLSGVPVEPCAGELTDHYDPRNNTVYLSQSVFSSNSAAACGVAAHECGHAIQHAEGYMPIKVRTALIPVTQIGSNLATPLFFIGIIFSLPSLSLIGALCFGLSTLFQFVTLPVEFNASSRALKTMEESYLVDESELSGAKKVLRAAAMTYVAALAVSLLSFLRLLAIALSGRRRR